MPDTPTSKEAVVLKLLAEGDTMLCLDARHQGVHVPHQHANNHALRLILNLNFPQPIEVTAQGVLRLTRATSVPMLCGWIERRKDPGIGSLPNLEKRPSYRRS